MPHIDKEKRKQYNREYYEKNKCIHNQRKDRCVVCNGSGICEHDKRKERCVECHGNAICEHNKRKNDCVECHGISICEHDKRKARCVECHGSQICEHNKRKSNCKTCSISTYLINLQKRQVLKIFEKRDNKKVKHSVEYLGCDSNYFLEYIKSKMIDGMTFDNIHIDHIKPISKFDLEDHDEFLKCCHYTNLQPLLSKDNLFKGNKWTEANEKFWNENITYKEYIPLYF